LLLAAYTGILLPYSRLPEALSHYRPVR